MLSHIDTQRFSIPGIKGITTFVMLLGLLIATTWHNTYAYQDSDTSLTELAQDLIVDRSEEVMRVSMEIEDMPLSEALKALTEKVGVGLSYSSDISLDQEVSLQLNNVPIHEVIYTLLEGTNLEPVLPPTKDVLVIREKKMIEEGSEIQETITGRVIDSQGDPIPGVTVVVSGTTIGTTTDSEGQYSLSIPPDAEYLTFSFVGMQSQNIIIEDQTTIDVVLESDLFDLGELVVVGYGIESRANVIGSVTAVRGQDITDAPVSSVSNALTGRLPGGIFMQESGEPGQDDPLIRVRGNSTLNNNDPLIVIDGVRDRNLNSLNPGDIENVTVLKDASAAIYGARAANGVILITTKRGSESPPTFTYKFSHGILTPTKLPEMADAPTYATMIREMESYRGLEEGSMSFSQEDVEKYASGEYPWTHPNTDWFDEALRDYSTTQRHDLSVRGGTENVRYFTSFGTQFDEGLNVNSNTSFNRYNLRANIDLNVNEYIDLRLDITGIREDRMYPTTSTSTIYRSIIRMYPTEHALFPNGLPGPNLTENWQPMVNASDETGFDEDIRYRADNTLYANFQIPGVEGLALSSYYAIDIYSRDRKLFQKPFTVYELDKSAYLDAGNTGIEDGSDFLLASQTPPAEPRLTDYSQNSTNRNFNIRLDYTTTIGESHNLSSFVSYEHNQFDEEGFNAFRRFFVSDQLPYLFAGGDDEKDNSGWAGIDASQNYFGRLSYNYDEKYLFQFSFRRDGSLRFSKEAGRWGNFPSVLVGWVPSEHNWWQNRLGFVDFFKLRGSYGQMGNDRVAPFQYFSSYRFDTGYILGSNKTYNPGLEQIGTPNPNITWEVANVYNFGWESYFFDMRLSFETDFFYEKRSDILVQRNVSVPRFTGISLPDENFGIVVNKGFETTIAFRNTNGRFSYGFSGNVAFARNRIVEVDEPETSVPWQRLTGKPMGSALLYNAIGIFRDENHVDSYPSVPGARPGDIIIEDVTGDGEITSDDRVLFTQTSTPEVTFGLSFDFAYRGWMLRGLIQGHSRAMRDLHTDSNIGSGGNYFQVYAEDRWTPDNPEGTGPRAFERTEEYWRGSHRTNYYLENVSYIRLRNLQLSYMIPDNLGFKIGATNARVYVAAQNPLLLYSGTDLMDPENFGMGAYPIMRAITMGTEISF